ncbi:chromosome partitioning protein [Gryllotalpicola protaetiae]|uniref:chromosome partitioning protein n=1 Tax=Gryllotalpicola protaetiae TaxID=2419771 RepID=UPI0013C51E0F|nr:chromosome partitioning protein [Gryllotalpicola protaetiae]
MTDTTPMTHTPHIEATVVRSAEGPYIGQISVDGSITTIEGRTEDGVRRDIIRAVAGVAQRLDRPVRLIARDSLGTQEVRVSPDGYTEALGPVAPAPAESGLDFDAIIGDQYSPDRHNPGQAPVGEDDTLTQPAGRAAAVPDLEYLFQSPSDEYPLPSEQRAKPGAAPAASSIPSVPLPPIVMPQPAATAPVTSTYVPPQPTAPAAPSAAEGAPAPFEPFVNEDAGLPLLPPAPPPVVDVDHLPTLDDFMAQRPEAPTAPAALGWQGLVRKASFGLISPAPGEPELARRSSVEAVQRAFAGPRTVVVINPKGGAHKTTATMMLAATFGEHRGGYTLAWDNNETRGTLGWRAQPAAHHRSAVSLLHDLDRFGDAGSSRIGDLDDYVRAQGSAQFDVLASDEDPNATDLVDADAFDRLHSTLQRFYRLIIVDTGNNMRAPNWLRAVEAADQLVIVTTVREDTAASAAWLVDGLREKGLEKKIDNAVTVLSATTDSPDPQLARRLRGHFGSLTRAVLEVPHDPALVDGGAISYELLSRSTREAWLHVAATVSEGL